MLVPLELPIDKYKLGVYYIHIGKFNRVKENVC